MIYVINVINVNRQLDFRDNMLQSGDLVLENIF